MHTPRRIALIGALAGALLLGTGTAALADPSSLPSTTSIVVVGSDTTQYLCDQFSTDYNRTNPPNAVYCWDAVNPTTGLPGDTIKTKNDANCSITRPNGTGAGIAQLQKKLKTTNGVDYCVDLARASRNIKSTDGAGIVSFLFAKDLITWAANAGGNAVASLTSTDLTAIYTCNASLINSSYSGAVTWKEVGGTSPDTIIPVLPQASSGTRAQWLADIGVTNPGACVINGGYNGFPIQENEGTNPVFTPTGDPTGWKDVITPYSAGVYVCQVYIKRCPDMHGNLVLKEIDGKQPLTTANTINVTGLHAFGAAYIRGLYFVSLNAGTASAPKIPTTPIDLNPFLNWVCTNSTAKTDTANFGFVVPSNCGALTGQ